MHTSQKLVEADLDAAIASNQEHARRDCPLPPVDGMSELKGWYPWACLVVIGLALLISVFAPPYGFIRP